MCEYILEYSCSTSHLTSSWTATLGALTNVNGGVKVMFVFVVDDVEMLLTGAICSVMVMSNSVVGNMVMLVRDVNGGVRLRGQQDGDTCDQCERCCHGGV
jgi:hypothetical protein